jgi:peptidoglycan/LPS O-acetylase OafA/YrhL
VAVAPAPAAASPSPTVAPPPGNPRFPLLDALRGLAALSIVVTHVAGVSGFNTDNPLGQFTARLNLGVTLFFLLSGFLLYRPFVAARRAGRPPVRLGAYARRRVLRIVPAYWVWLTVLGLWPGLVAFWDGPWWRSYTFTQIYWGPSTLQGLGPAWTLCIELSFYLLLPVLAAALGRAGGVRGELAALAALGIASVALRTGLQAAGGSYVLQNTLAGHFGWFAIGMALAVVSVDREGREDESAVLRAIVRRPWLPWAAALAVFAVLSTTLGLPRGFYLVYTTGSYLGEHLLYALVAALVMLPAVFGDGAGGWPRRLLAHPVLAWLGLVSYGVFLVHTPFVLELDAAGAEGWIPGSGLLSLTAATLAVTIPLAALSFYGIERPAMRLRGGRPRGSSARSRVAAARASAGA